MSVVKTPDLLVQPHQGLIERIRLASAINDECWQTLYEPLVMRTAAQLQELVNRPGDSYLLFDALSSSLAAVHRCDGVKFDEFPHLMRYLIFAAALTYDCAAPAADLEVAVQTTDGKHILWEPLDGSTIDQIGKQYTANWTARGLSSSHVVATVAWMMLPSTARRLLCTERKTVHEFMFATTPGSKLSKFLPQLDRKSGAPVPLLQEFLDYVQNLIDSDKYNRPESRLHAVESGLFLMTPDIFVDFDTARASRIKTELETSYLIMPNQKSKERQCVWKFCNPHGRKLKGWVIDPKLAGLKTPSKLSGYLEHHTSQT